MNKDKIQIILHTGTTFPLPKPEVARGQTYPFRFDAVFPNVRSWPYRVLTSSDPAHLTSAQLARMLSNRGWLRATWEQQVGHPVGLLTVYPVASDGSSDALRAKCEAGQDLEIDPPSPATPAPNSPSLQPPAPPTTPSHVPASIEAKKPYSKSLLAAQLPEQKAPSNVPAKPNQKQPTPGLDQSF
jgi:hypothetical protein